MIKFDDTEVYGFDEAIRGMRNSFNSWDKSDSHWSGEEYDVGFKDLALMHKLYKAGPDHAKFLRQIQVWVDVKAPLYWWKQMDQYSVGVTSNSTSTMHMIQSKEFTLDDFSHEHLTDKNALSNANNPLNCMEHIITCLNWYRKLYLGEKDKSYWWQMIQLLPSSYNQLRTLNLNYAVLANAYCSRKGHRLDEWEDFRKWCESLPHFKQIILGE